MVAMGNAPESDSPLAAAGSTWTRLKDQVNWYDRRVWPYSALYRRLKLVQLLAAAAVPVVAAADASGWTIAAIGGVVLVLEGLQQLGQYRVNRCIAYRSTCEALRHEKHLYLAGAGPCTNQASAARVLAERVEGLASQEHAKWISAREESASAAIGST